MALIKHISLVNGQGDPTTYDVGAKAADIAYDPEAATVISVKDKIDSIDHLDDKVDKSGGSLAATVAGSVTSAASSSDITAADTAAAIWGKFNALRAEYGTHSGSPLYSQAGVHGMRYYEGLLQVWDTTEQDWVDVSTTGGHVIVDAAGEDMVQEDRLQFVDSQVTDDSANGKTKIEIIKNITSAQLATAGDGIYNVTDEPAETGVDADQVFYDNTTSGLIATDVQDAIDEVVEEIDMETVTATGNPLSVTTDSEQVANHTAITFEPIQAGSGDPSPSNPRYIIGNEKITIQSTSKNIFNVNNIIYGYLVDGDPALIIKSISDTWMTNPIHWDGSNSSLYLKIYSKGAYTNGSISVFGSQDGITYSRLIYISNTSGISDGYSTSVNNIPSTTRYICACGYMDGNRNNNNIASIKMEVSATINSELYEIPVTDISIQLNDTLYDGTLDVESGELTVTHKSVDMGSLDWEWSSPNSCMAYYDLNDRRVGKTRFKCEIYNVVNKSNSDLSNYEMTGAVTTVGIFVKDSSYGSSDAAAFKTAVTGKKIVYELATSIKIQLSPHQVKLLLGNNVVTTNGTSLNLTYRNGKIAKLNDVEDVSNQINNKIDYLTGSEKTVTGNPLTFDTDSEQVAKNTVITFEPKQIGTGDPSPNNVRDIFGSNEIHISDSLKNIYDIKWLVNGALTYSNGEVVGNARNWYYSFGKEGIPKLGRIDKQITISFKAKTDGNASTAANEGLSVIIVYMDGTTTPKYILNNTTSFTDISVTSDFGKSIKGIVFSFWNTGDNIWHIKDFQIELGSTATTYEPYNPITDISIKLNETIYGGTLDVESGKLVVNKVKAQLPVSGWGSTGGAFYNSLVNCPAYKLDGIAISNIEPYQGVVSSGSGVLDKKFALYSESMRVYVRDSSFASVSDFMTFLSSNPMEIVYELATPITIQLPPAQVKLLQGANVVTTNGTSMNLTYRNGEVAKLSDLSGLADSVNGLPNIYITDSVISANSAKNLNSYPYTDTTKTENGITFTDNDDGTVTVNGTATADTYFFCHNHYGANVLNLEKRKYKGSGCPTGGSVLNGYYIQYYYVDARGNGVYFNDEGNGVSFDLTNVIDYFHGDKIRVGVVIYVLNGTTVNNLTFKPMITLADQPNSDYAHYVEYAMTNKQLTEKVNEPINVLKNDGTSNNIYDIKYIFVESADSYSDANMQSILANYVSPSNYMGQTFLTVQFQGGVMYNCWISHNGIGYFRVIINSYYFNTYTTWKYSNGNWS